MNDDIELQEYFVLVKSVSEFDQRILTVKGWGVTLSLAALGFGFQYRSYGLFLVAAASSVAFWTLEGAMKQHQMRHYPRLREIEVNRFKSASPESQPRSAPRSDWSWATARDLFHGKTTGGNEGPVLRGRSVAYDLVWLLPHVALPHVITFGLGLALFGLGYCGWLAGFTLGAVAKAG